MGKDRRTLRKIRKTLSESIKRIRELERDFPITTIAWMDLSGELSSIDKDIRAELISLARSANEYRRRYWKLEVNVRQDFVHHMNRIGFSPSFSPQVETLANHLPRSLVMQDGRVWVFSYGAYIKDIASGVGRDSKEAPGASQTFERFKNKYNSEVRNIREQAEDLIIRMDAFRSRIGEYLRLGAAWSQVPTEEKTKKADLRPDSGLIIIRKPYPLPKPPKRPRKKIFRRMKREVIGPEVRK